MNKVIMLGRVTQEVNYNAQYNMALINFVHSHYYKDRQGNKQQESCFITIKASGALAETAKKYFTKGILLLIEGQLKMETWTDQNGNKRQSYSIFLQTFEFVETKESATKRQESQNVGDKMSENHTGDMPPF